jgi:hypothetical protein
MTPVQSYYHADRSRARSANPTFRNRRGDKPQYDPIQKMAKQLSDIMWTRAKDLAQVLAPEHPHDQEPLSDFESWMLLERVAMAVSPNVWDDPNALSDLYKLRGQFLPSAPRDHLKLLAKQAKQEEDALPDAMITPADPEFDKRQKRIARMAS